MLFEWKPNWRKLIQFTIASFFTTYAVVATSSNVHARPFADPHEATQYNFHTAYIQGEGDVKGVKVAIQRQSNFITAKIRQIGFSGTINFELSANYWVFGPDNTSDKNAAFALSPVLTFPMARIFDTEILGEFGIGVSLLDDTKFAGKNVSTHYQFEDRLGLIAKLSAKDSINLRYLHYSNAGFKKPNPGLDFVSIGYSHLF